MPGSFAFTITASNGTAPITYTITLHKDWSYSDGCGGTLTTHQTFVGTYLAPAQPH